MSDRRRPDHVLSDPELGGRREIQKEENEGTEHSCHVILATRPILDGGNCYRTTVELVPQFSTVYVRRYLRHLFKTVSIEREHSVHHPYGIKANGKFVRIPVYVDTSVRAVPSDELLRDLESGRLLEIEVSKEVNGVQGFDERAYTVDKRSKLLLGLTKAQEGVAPLDVIKSVCREADKRKYSIAKVVWGYDGGERKASASFDCDTATPIESKYVRRHTFILDSPLPASCESISNQFVEQMIKWII